MNSTLDPSLGRHAALRSWFVVIGLLVCSLAQGSPLIVYTVGSPGCDYFNLRSALDAAATVSGGPGEIPPLVEIHLAVPEDDSLGYSWNGSNSEVVLADLTADISVIGGYSSCGSTEPAAGAYTTLGYADADSDATHSLLTVSNTLGNPKRYVDLRNIRMLGASDASKGGPTFGGGLRVSGNAFLGLWNSRVSGFHGSGGGGVALIGSSSVTDPSMQPKLLVFRDSVIANNTASAGGGIYSSYGRVVIDGATIIGNTATNKGGGIFMQDLQDAGGTDDDSHFALLLDNHNGPNFISGNVAGNGTYSTSTGLGGGVYSQYGQIMFKRHAGSAKFQSYVSSNEANRGGGIFVQGPSQGFSGPTTWFVTYDTMYNGNLSRGQGGALFLQDAVFGRVDSYGSCTVGFGSPHTGPCSYFGDNEAEGSDGAGEIARGGAIYLENTRSDGLSYATLLAFRAWFNGNSDPNGTAAVATAGGTSRMLFARDIFTNNAAKNTGGAKSALIYSFNGEDVYFGYNTVLDSNTSTRMFNMVGGDLDVTGSILWGTVDRTHPFHFVWFASGGATMTHQRCLLVRASDDGTAGIPGPEFLWAGSPPDLDARFAPRGGSAAIDHCEPPGGGLADAYLNLVHDTPGVESRYGIQDLGAVEQTDIIFANMFGERPDN